MNIKHIIKLVISVCLLQGITPVLAQQPDNLNREVQVTRAYDPIISDANKIDVKITIDDTLTNIKKVFDYSVLSRGVTSTYSIRPIPAATIIEQAYTDPHFLYARLGIGYPLSPLADIYINNYSPSGLSVGAFYNFRSIFGDISNDNPNGYDLPIDELSHNAGAYVKKHFDWGTVGADVGFNHHKVLFYGYDPAINYLWDYKPNKDSIAQAYNSIDVRLFLESANKDIEAFRYRIAGRFNNFGDNGKDKFDFGRQFSMNESTVGGELYLGKLFAGSHLFGVNADFNYYNRKLEINETNNKRTNNRYHFVILPSYTFANDKFELMVGAKFDMAKENTVSGTSESKMYIRPKASISYAMADEFVPYAAIDGGREINNYRKIANENPFITPGMNFDMLNTLHDYQIKGGFRGNIQKIFSYNAYAAYTLSKNMYFYYNSSGQSVTGGMTDLLYNNFDVVYDEVQEFKISAEMELNYKVVKASLKANYFNYSLSDIDAPLHRPDFNVTFNTDVTVARYLILSARMYAQTKTPYKYYAEQDEILYNKGFFDIGLGAEYLFTRSFSAFINVNNLLNDKYMMWNLYKVPGIHVQGGITFKF